MTVDSAQAVAGPASPATVAGVDAPEKLAAAISSLEIAQDEQLPPAGTPTGVPDVVTSADATAAATATPTAAPSAAPSTGAEATPPHRSHDPQYNQKRSDPFQFGSRYLNQEDDVFEFNAWDHVETDDTYKEYAEQQYAMQRQAPVSDFDKSKCFFSCFSSIPLPVVLAVCQPAGACDDLHFISIVHLNFYEDTYVFYSLSLPSDAPFYLCRCLPLAGL